MSIYLSAPAIARLSACSRIAAYVSMRNGRYGALLQRGRVPYADLAEVERNTGRQFSPEQIAMAVDGRPARLITIAVEE
jgi:aspartate aminotransferase-like enzyme